MSTIHVKGDIIDGRQVVLIDGIPAEVRPDETVNQAAMRHIRYLAEHAEEGYIRAEIETASARHTVRVMNSGDTVVERTDPTSHPSTDEVEAGTKEGPGCGLEETPRAAPLHSHEETDRVPTPTATASTEGTTGAHKSTASASLSTRRPFRLIGVGVASVTGALLIAGAVWNSAAERDGAEQEAPLSAAQASPSPLSPARTPRACLGGGESSNIAREAGDIAVSSTITQSGVTTPSPAGAVEAAHAIARLRFSPSGAEAYRSMLAAAAKPAAQALPSVGAGTKLVLDPTATRWKLVSGNGARAEVGLLLTQRGAAGGKQVAVTSAKVTIALQGGKWRLVDWSPFPASALTTAPTLDKQGC